jgi:dienelactone hydrolase
VQHTVNTPFVSLLAACAVQSTNLDGAVDGSRVGLWGVSYGGAHVLVTAAKFGRNISAVIANVSRQQYSRAVTGRHCQSCCEQTCQRGADAPSLISLVIE